MNARNGMMNAIKKPYGEVSMKMQMPKLHNPAWKRRVSLVLIFTMLFSIFMHQGWYEPPLAEAAPTANGMAVYSNNATTPVYRNYTASTNTYAAQANMAAGAAQTFFVQKAANTRNERIAGYVTTGGVLYVQRWNGTTWSAEWNVTVGGNGVNGRRFDIVYEDISGDAMVVYSTNVNGNAGAEMAYRVWNGSTWTAATNLPNSARLAQAAAVTAIKLASRPGSDEIAVFAADSGTTTANTATFTSFIWNGSAWGNEPTSTFGTTYNTTGQLFQNDLFDLAYESVSGDLITVFTTATPQQNYRTYSAGAWSAVTSFATGRAAPLQMVAASNPNTNQVLIIFNRSASANVYGRVWDGAAMSTVTTIGANGVTTAVSKKHITGKWLNVGGTDYAVAMWVTSTAGTIGYNQFTGGAWGTAATYATGVAVADQWLDSDVDPYGAETLMLTFSDANSDLHARRLVLSAGPTYTWTTPTGSPLTATLATTGGITTQNFDFEYTRFAPFFSFSAATYSQAEGNSGTVNATITVSRTGDTSGTNAIDYATSNGTATTADNDYVAAAGTLTFTAGQASQTFGVTINGDAKYENNETVNLALSNPTNNALLTAPTTATLTITNDDSAPSVAFNAATTAAYSYSNQVNVPVSLSGSSAFVGSVAYATANGTAIAGTDYTATSGTLVFKANEITKYITVPLINNAGINGKTFTVTLSGPVNVTLGAPSTNTVTINRKYASSNSTCADCHAYGPLDGARDGSTGSVAGDHDVHIYACSTCHVAPATTTSADFGHRNGNIQMQPGATGIDGGYYNQDGLAGYAAADSTFAQRNSPTTSTCITIACHGGANTPQWGVGTTDCTVCHNVALGSRRAVIGEFGMTWNHGAANKFACGVCHMEGAVSGNVTTGKTNPAYHGNGMIDLRDPNTGTQMQGVTWAGPDAGSYSSTGSALSFAQFSRDLNSASLEAPVAAITINHCLHCHDAGGSVVYASGGSSTNPFATGVAPLDVDTQFNTGNASYHPVKGKQNNSYIDLDTMETPWNQASKTPATNTQWGDLMSCFDCHAANNASGTQTSTVVAHGGNTTLRALYDAVDGQATKLCVVCHKTSVYWATNVHSATDTSPGNGVSGFAYATDPDGYTSYHGTNHGEYFGCTVCHGTTGDFTTWTPAMPARPEGATNTHGFNTPNWPNGTRPYSFIRYATFTASNTKWTDWSTGASAGCNGTNMCNDGRGPYTYGPGGTY